jgi:hypothetical protein
MNRFAILAFLLISLSSCHSLKQNPPTKELTLTNLYDSASYAWGLNFGEFLKGYYYSSLDFDLMQIGLEQSFRNDSALFTPEEVKVLVREYGQLIVNQVGSAISGNI